MSQPCLVLLLDRGLQESSVRESGQAEGLPSPAMIVVDAAQSSRSRSPAGGSPEFGDLPSTAVEPIGGTVGGQRGYVHEAVLLRTSAARKPPTKESPSPMVVGCATSSSLRPGMQRTTDPMRSSSSVANAWASGRTGNLAVNSYCSSV